MSIQINVEEEMRQQEENDEDNNRMSGTRMLRKSQSVEEFNIGKDLIKDMKARENKDINDNQYSKRFNIMIKNDITIQNQLAKKQYDSQQNLLRSIGNKDLSEDVGKSSKTKMTIFDAKSSVNPFNPIRRNDTPTFKDFAYRNIMTTEDEQEEQYLNHDMLAQYHNFNPSDVLDVEVLNQEEMKHFTISSTPSIMSEHLENLQKNIDQMHASDVKVNNLFLKTQSNQIAH